MTWHRWEVADPNVLSPPPLQPDGQCDSDDDMAKKTPSKLFPHTWTQNGKAYWAVAETDKTIPAGCYMTAWNNQNGAVIERLTIETDGLVMFNDPQTKRLSKEFSNFWTLKKKYQSMGFLHKRGYLLWGPPGGGKTSLINVLMNEVTDKLKGIVLFIKNPGVAVACLQMFRNIEPDRPLFIVLEDLDALVEDNEADYLALLDGSAQVDNVVFVATTNYPEKLDQRFTDRPSRFDRIEFIGMPSMAQRHHFLRLKSKGLSELELKKWAAATDGLSVAHLRELILAVQCLDQPVEEVIARLKGMHESLPCSRDSKNKEVGFHRKRREDDEDEDEERAA